MLVQLPPTHLIQTEFLHLFTVFEIDWLHVVDSQQSQQKNTNIMRSNLMLLQGFICFVDEDTLIGRHFCLLIFTVHDEAHFLQNFIENYIIDDCFGTHLDFESFQQCEILFDELLSCVFVAVEGGLFLQFFGFANYLLFLFFLSSLSIVVEMLGNRLVAL